MYTGLRPWARRPIDHLVVVGGGVLLLVPEYVPSHRLHQQRRGVVHGLVHVDHRRLLAAQHIARVTEIPHKITGTTLS